MPPAHPPDHLLPPVVSAYEHLCLPAWETPTTAGEPELLRGVVGPQRRKQGVYHLLTEREASTVALAIGLLVTYSPVAPEQL